MPTQWHSRQHPVCFTEGFLDGPKKEGTRRISTADISIVADQLVDGVQVRRQLLSR